MNIVVCAKQVVDVLVDDDELHISVHDLVEGLTAGVLRLLEDSSRNTPSPSVIDFVIAGHTRRPHDADDNQVGDI